MESPASGGHTGFEASVCKSERRSLRADAGSGLFCATTVDERPIGDTMSSAARCVRANRVASNAIRATGIPARSCNGGTSTSTSPTVEVRTRAVGPSESDMTSESIVEQTDDELGHLVDENSRRVQLLRATLIEGLAPIERARRDIGSAEPRTTLSFPGGLLRASIPSMAQPRKRAKPGIPQPGVSKARVRSPGVAKATNHEVRPASSAPPPSGGRALVLAPKQKAVRAYYEALTAFEKEGASHEGAVRDAFSTLLKHCAKQVGWTLIGEYSFKRAGRHPAEIDGALVKWRIARAYWEAKDSHDDLEREIKQKIADGYPTDNTVFQAPERAILYQNHRRVVDADLRDPDALVGILKLLFEYQRPQIDRWDQAAVEFGERVPKVAEALIAIIAEERKANSKFVAAFGSFAAMCRHAINPNIADDAVERMLVQHLLTERIFRRVFSNSDFSQRNVIAVEIERVIRALTSRSFNRDAFLAELDHFYVALERAAATIDDYTQKQEFLNTVYERFFQGYDEKAADKYGIVYTPQPLVKFIVSSVEDLLRREFGKALGDENVHIIDPFVGTGNFLLHLIERIPRSQLAAKYRNELHANEIMLLPYYVAAMNIEHEYANLTGNYEPFEGLCLVDTFELAEPPQLALLSEANSRRVEKQKQSPIFVIVGNPPYNAWQINENDKNRNRKYPILDKRVSKTYSKDSGAQLVNSLSDPYVKAFRWASDRLGEEGILAFVSNSSYLSERAFDGMRKHLTNDFDAIYVLDLGGNVRKNPKLSGTVHNVFGIQVGVAIGLFVRRKGEPGVARKAEVFYAKTGEDWRKGEKFKFLNEKGSCTSVEWQRIEPDARNTWLREGLKDDFESLIPLVANSGTKAHGGKEVGIFQSISNGLKSNNDAFVFDFSRERLSSRARKMVTAYNAQLARWEAEDRPADLEGFLTVDETALKWIRKTKKYLLRGERAKFSDKSMRVATYRPFTAQHVFLDRMFNEDVYQLERMFAGGPLETPAIVMSGVGHRSPFSVLAVRHVPEQHLCASTDAFQVMPLRLFNADGSSAHDNVTAWAVDRFRRHYRDERIGQRDIFNYVYGLLHHPEYRERYKEDLKRDLPRIVLAADFRALANAGERLMTLHLDYEKQPEYPLARNESSDRRVKVSWRVERMKLSKDRTEIVYNDFLMLSGVPTETFAYRLGNRSALEWIIDQYRVTTDGRTGLVSDPNRLDDEDYIVRLIGQVIYVSVETVRIIASLPPLGDTHASQVP